MLLRFLQRRRRQLGAERGAALKLGVGLLAIWLCYRLLASVWSLFEHAYLNSIFLLPGAQVNQAYWGAVRFAFHVTVIVVALGTAIAVLVALQLAGARRR